MKLQNPHDKFFKATLGNTSTARDFLTNYLPPNIMAIIDLDTLESQKDSFINEELRESFSDLLFKATINKEEGYLYFLFEHKSYPSRDIAFQLLKYMLEIWNTKTDKQNPHQLAVIIPLVIYHGKEDWNIKTNFRGMIHNYEKLPADMQVFIPDYKYLLYDISGFSDEEIKGAVITRTMMLIMRDIYVKDPTTFLETFDKVTRLIGELEDKETGLEYFRTLLRYVYSAKSDLTQDDHNIMIKRVKTTYPEGSEEAMTLAELFREEGMKRGMEKGIVKGIEQGETKALARTALKLLSKKFNIIPGELKDRILKLDSATLDIIIDGILDYKNIEDVKKHLQ